eukprot:TRINITY_DN11364_c0_g1_i1.p1 TRINITY_DN11364_c0_g1~~TRINITY_DN11364_c0_g1_i1.p1  ORF type:complete len:454 (-),score=81.98 TRINITY_DN11364_c0_g1_i1:29-1390(-)
MTEPIHSNIAGIAAAAEIVEDDQTQQQNTDSEYLSARDNIENTPIFLQTDWRRNPPLQYSFMTADLPLSASAPAGATFAPSLVLPSDDGDLRSSVSSENQTVIRTTGSSDAHLPVTPQTTATKDGVQSTESVAHLKSRIFMLERAMRTYLREKREKSYWQEATREPAIAFTRRISTLRPEQRTPRPKQSHLRPADKTPRPKSPDTRRHEALVHLVTQNRKLKDLSVAMERLLRERRYLCEIHGVTLSEGEGDSQSQTTPRSVRSTLSQQRAPPSASQSARPAEHTPARSENISMMRSPSTKGMSQEEYDTIAYEKLLSRVSLHQTVRTPYAHSKFPAHTSDDTLQGHQHTVDELIEQRRTLQETILQMHNDMQDMQRRLELTPYTQLMTTGSVSRPRNVASVHDRHVEDVETVSQTRLKCDEITQRRVALMERARERRRQQTDSRHQDIEISY